MVGHKKRCACGTEVWVTRNQAGSTVEVEVPVVGGGMLYKVTRLGARTAGLVHREHHCSA